MIVEADQQQKSSASTVLIAVGCALVLALFLGMLVVPGFLFTMFFTAASQQKGQCLPGGGTSIINGSNQAPYTGAWMNPMIGEFSSPFGWRIHPVTGARSNHSGQDIAAADNTPIHAAGSGTVTIAGASSGGNTGFMVAIDHGGGVQSRYVHMWPEDIKVKVGQKVQVGEVVGLEGSSGQATGPHLHFEIRLNGKPTEPIAWMKAKGVDLGKGPTQAPATQASQVEAAPSEKSDDQKVHDAAQSHAVIPAAGGPVDAQGKVFKSSSGEKFNPSPEQWANLQRVLQAVDKSGMGKKAAVITIMTVIVESRARMYANSTVPDSLSLPHQAVGSDHDSVGLFQQRPSMGWGSVKELMTVDYSTNKFLSVLKTTKGWKDMKLGDAAQAVQRSGFPDAYAKWESAATAIVNGQGANFAESAADISCGSGPKPAQTQPQEAGQSGETPSAAASAPTPSQDPGAVRAKIESELSSKIGVPYLPGGRDPKGWDGNGMIWWAAEQAGLKGIPYVDAYTAGTETDQPQGGDLVTCGQRPDGSWRTSGIRTSEDPATFYVPLQGQGTIKTPLPSSCTFYSLVD